MVSALFQAFRDIAYEQAGIRLRDGKEALVSARLARRMRDLGLSSEAAYLELLQSDRSGREMVHFLNSIATNYTSFYRERIHFEILEAQARELVHAGGGRFRVWCAASSSGEEPYSIALTLADVFRTTSVDYRILATDISTRVLEKAVQGRYSEQQLAPVPRKQRCHYFRRTTSDAEDETTYEVVPALRAKVVFKRLNLAMPPFPMRGPLQVVMCRNVMIYFDQEVRQRLVSEIERLLAPEGILMIGHSETLNGIQSSLRPLKPSVYRKILG